MRPRFLLLFVFSLLVFAVVNMPVQQLFRFVAPPPGLVIEGLDGRIHGGRLRRLEYQGLGFDEVSYRLRPQCLLWLAVCYRLTSASGDLNLRLSWSPISGLRIEQGRVRQPMARLRPLMGSLLIQPTGALELQIDRLVLNRGRLGELEGHVIWRQAGIEGEKLVLGDFRADARRGEEGLELQFADLPGALLGVEGSLRLGTEDYRLELDLQARPGLSESARNALELLARKNGLNRYQVRNQGRLPKPLTLLAAPPVG